MFNRAYRLLPRTGTSLFESIYYNHTSKILMCELAKPELNFDIHTNML